MEVYEVIGQASRQVYEDLDKACTNHPTKRLILVGEDSFGSRKERRSFFQVASVVAYIAVVIVAACSVIKPAKNR